MILECRFDAALVKMWWYHRGLGILLNKGDGTQETVCCHSSSPSVCFSLFLHINKLFHQADALVWVIGKDLIKWLSIPKVGSTYRYSSSRTHWYVWFYMAASPVCLLGGPISKACSSTSMIPVVSCLLLSLQLDCRLLSVKDCLSLLSYYWLAVGFLSAFEKVTHLAKRLCHNMCQKTLWKLRGAQDRVLEYFTDWNVNAF